MSVKDILCTYFYKTNYSHPKKFLILKNNKRSNLETWGGYYSQVV